MTGGALRHPLSAVSIPSQQRLRGDRNLTRIHRDRGPMGGEYVPRYPKETITSIRMFFSVPLFHSASGKPAFHQVPTAFNVPGPKPLLTRYRGDALNIVGILACDARFHILLTAFTALCVWARGAGGKGTTGTGRPYRGFNPEPNLRIMHGFPIPFRTTIPSLEGLSRC